MKTLPFVLLLALAGCATSIPKWHRDEAGYATSGIKPGGKGSAELRDPLEDVPEFAEAFATASDEAQKLSLVYGHRDAQKYYQVKKRILRDRFHIDWKTPVELNPWTKFD